MLAAMFSSRRSMGLTRDSTGAFFIDYDGLCFGDVLNYLRDDGSFIPSLEAVPRERLLRAAMYFQLVGLIQYLSAEKEQEEMSFASKMVKRANEGAKVRRLEEYIYPI